MDANTNGSRPARRRAVAAAVCSVIVAVVGGALMTAPAYASSITNGSTCATTQLLGGTVGGLTLENPNCGAPVIGVRTTPTATPVATATPIAATAPAPGGAATSDESSSSPTTESATVRTTAASKADDAPLSTVSVQSSTDSVYPVKDGYLDDVRFEIKALSAAGQLVPAQGTAILSKAGRIAEAWTLDDPTTVLSWDGRVDGKIKRGVYTLQVTLYSADGSTRTTENRVRVLTKHVERRAVVVHSTVRGNDTMAAMPAEVLKAYAKGIVTVRVRTDAKVRGHAKLVYSNDGVVRSLTLRNGVHTGPAEIVPEGFEHVTITHKWAKGAAQLKSANAIWTYYTLVK